VCRITVVIFFFSSRRRHTRFSRDWSSDVCSSDLPLFVHGEILALDEQGRASFQLLQSRMGLAHAPGRAARRAAAVPVHLILFDRSEERRAGKEWRSSWCP